MIFRMLLAAAFALTASASSAATITFAGARDVSVNGVLYDVEFIDGSCVSLFNGCDDPSDFTFNSLEATGLANRALADLLETNPDLDFNRVPLTGCAALTPCNILTPYAGNNGLVGNGVLANGGPNFIRSRLLASDIDLSTSPGFVYARWTQAETADVPVAPVPLPATGLLLIGSLVGLGVLKRKHSKTKS